MARLFGTDGVRGVANTDLSCDIAYYLGQAAVRFMGSSIVVGRDTRRSGHMLMAALSAGIMSAGGTVLDAGIIPTPAVALLVRELHCDGGVVISASHNPPEYNGIKFFDARGFKLSDEKEDRIEDFIRQGGLEGEVAAIVENGTKTVSTSTATKEHPAPTMPTGPFVGTAISLHEACDLYVNHAVNTIRAQGIDFSGLTIALDVGHGASTYTSPRALRELGATVITINEDFNGDDINVGCGSTRLTPLKALVKQSGADVGIAHDGDADRVMIVAPDGTEIDGDMIEVVCALDMKDRGVLPGETVVSTVMCNLGLVHIMRDHGINVVQTKVGDRYVLEEMREHGYAIGGEPSGHLILLDLNTTGDGLMTACQFLAALKRSGKTVAEATDCMKRFPQRLLNVQVNDKHTVGKHPDVQHAVSCAEAALGENGRVLLRPSGTEPVIRVMVEASDQSTADTHAYAIADVVKKVGAA